MRLDPSAFNGFLSEIGQDYQWRRAHACPCVSPSSGAARLQCAHCGGKGQLWAEPRAARLGTSGRDVQKTWANFGQYEAGDQVVVVPSDSPAYGIGPYDRLLSLNRSEPFSMNLVVGVNEAIRFPVESVERVLYEDADGALLDAPVPRVLKSGVLEWGPDGPPAAATYSVTGRRRSEFFVFQDMPFDRPHHAGASLPRRVVLRRFDLYSR